MKNTLSIVKHTFTLLMLALFLGAGFFFVDHAEAATLLCRSDPIVFLSDGTRLQFEAVVATTPEDVLEVRYELHGPAGASIVREIHPESTLSDKETFQYFADQPAGHYHIVMHVQTISQDVRVRARARVFARDGRNIWRERTVLNGHSNQSITIDFDQPS